MERDSVLSESPDELSRSLARVEWLERTVAVADVSRLPEIEKAWLDVAPLFRAYILGDAALDPERKIALLTIANGFDQLNRTERGRQLAWSREQGIRRRVEPN
jgi:hypothetical protein